MAESIYLELAQEKEKFIVADALVFGSYGAALFLAGVTFYYLAEAIANSMVPSGKFSNNNLGGASLHALVGLLVLAALHFVIRVGFTPKPSS
jgi:hypothetical protein